MNATLKALLCGIGSPLESESFPLDGYDLQWPINTLAVCFCEALIRFFLCGRLGNPIAIFRGLGDWLPDRSDPKHRFFGVFGVEGWHFLLRTAGGRGHEKKQCDNRDATDPGFTLHGMVLSVCRGPSSERRILLPGPS